MQVEIRVQLPQNRRQLKLSPERYCQGIRQPWMKYAPLLPSKAMDTVEIKPWYFSIGDQKILLSPVRFYQGLEEIDSHPGYPRPIVTQELNSDSDSIAHGPRFISLPATHPEAQQSGAPLALLPSANENKTLLCKERSATRIVRGFSMLR